MNQVSEPKPKPEKITAETKEAKAFLDFAKKIVRVPAPETKGKTPEPEDGQEPKD